MYAIASDVAAHLGRPLSAAETGQVELWIGWLEADIDARLPGMPFEVVTAQRVIVQSIAAYMDNPTAATQVSFQVDDGAVTKRYTSSSGRVQVLPELWADLGYVEASGSAFTIVPG